MINTTDTISALLTQLFILIYFFNEMILALSVFVNLNSWLTIFSTIIFSLRFKAIMYLFGTIWINPSN